MKMLIALGMASMACLQPLWAHLPEKQRGDSNRRKQNVVSQRDAYPCANSLAAIDQEINNVRARLLAGGDCWWDLSDGRYVVPKVDPSTGQKEVSSIFAASVWLGGRDPGGSLKLACQNYRKDASGQVRNDFWPGPLNEDGQTEGAICDQWDRHFRVTGDDIRRHIRNIALGNKNLDDMPKSIKGWPSRNNPHFYKVWGFDLPKDKGLAGFHDINEDGDYEPLEGDFPSIEIRNCGTNIYPDEMIFWIYNDQGGGNPHARTGGEAIQMEVQVQAFGYVSNDELNDMTFQRYQLNNKASEYIDDTYFAMWVDPDLGCPVDDYIGCDSTLDLMYVYNQDDVDGSSGATCIDGIATYGNKIPMLGVDYFRGPKRQIIDPVTGDLLAEEELGMSSFTYHNGINAPPGTEDPQSDDEFYNLLKGLWRTGQPVTRGGNGLGGAIPTKFVFSDPPNDPTGWSMCTANLPYADRRTLQATGPFRLDPGASNELIIGVPWVPEIEHPCPDLGPLFRADRLAQTLFDNCFQPQESPDAPFVDWIELDRQVVAVLNYPDSLLTNNYRDAFQYPDIFAPKEVKESEMGLFRFQGYKIYQLRDPNVTAAEYETNTEKSRLVAQVDVKDTIVKIFNWREVENPGSNIYYTPELKVKAENKGVRHVFPITEDRFSTSNDKRLVNHKKYYFVAIAYAYNNWQQFKPEHPATGQQKPYLPSRRAGYGTGQILPYTVIPRPIVDRVLESAYGDGVEITRYQGAGVNQQFLDLKDESRDALFNWPAGEDTLLTYKRGKGPLNITIFNPIDLKDAAFELQFTDNNPNDDVLSPDARWELRRLPDGALIKSESSIAAINEQVVKEYGFTVNISQAEEPGAGGERNGAIGMEIAYANPDSVWLLGYPDEAEGVFNYIRTGGVESDALLDPKQDLSTLGNGYFVPFHLANWRYDTAEYEFLRNGLITPAWTNRTGLSIMSQDKRRLALAGLPNVDIVFTQDKSKWSRCIVVESAAYTYVEGSPFEKDAALSLESPAGKPRRTLDTRYAPSVGKEDKNGDGLPDPDQAVYPNRAGIPNAWKGKPAYGLSWFPGYAIDVETGRRLNVFFGENSAYKQGLDGNNGYTGRDLLWNPTSQVLRETPGLPFDYYNLVMGGQHWIYVTNTNYDSCFYLMTKLTPDFFATAATDVVKRPGLEQIAWTGMIQLAPQKSMKSLEAGLVPDEAIVKLRVNNTYQTWYDETGKKRNPVYRFRINGQEARSLDVATARTMLDSVKVVPNPYYGFSQYELSNFSNTVKITNLPAKCTVTIYSLDGKFIRQYTRDAGHSPYMQIVPDLEWDIKNSKGIPVASGVYLIYINAPGVGERTIKWFGVTRKFDPTGL